MMQVCLCAAIRCRGVVVIWRYFDVEVQCIVEQAFNRISLFSNLNWSTPNNTKALSPFSSSPLLSVSALNEGAGFKCHRVNLLRNWYSPLNQIKSSMSNTIDPQTGFVSRTFGKLSTVQPKDQLVSFLTTAKGKDIFGRYTPALTYLEQVERDGLAVEKRGLLSAPGSTTTAADQESLNYFGDNFASNNYLGLAQHPSTVEAGIEAAKTFGVNSAGSPLAFGATKYFIQLRDEIAEFWDCKTLIYSAGWLSGYGTMKSLIREYDHIIIDEFCDNSFFQGAYAATKNVKKNRHLDEAHITQLLAEVRSKDKENGIFVVTEAIFPLDSSSPNLVNIQRIAKQYNAFVAISCAHDFGIIGEQGRGVWEEQGLKDRSNVVLVGTGSKTSSINFGFVGCTHFAVPEYMKYYSAAYMFTNAINPVQANAALATLRIIRSQEGHLLRKQLLQNCNYLRKKFTDKGHTPLGRPSGFVCIRVGDEIVSRIIVRVLMDNQIHVNNVEYPLAPLGGAVVRFSLNPQHTREQMDKLVAAFDFSLKKAKAVRAEQTPKVAAKL